MICPECEFEELKEKTLQFYNDHETIPIQKVCLCCDGCKYITFKKYVDINNLEGRN